MLHWNFGLAWIAFALAVALHVADEASHDFLAIYNPNARAIRAKLHIPVPVFTFRAWLVGLIIGIALLLALSPLAFHGAHWLRVTALPLAVLVGVFNALLHLGGSLLYRRKLAGVLSSPVLLAAGVWLLWSASEWW
jgi:hypothetical protein